MKLAALFNDAIEITACPQDWEGPRGLNKRLNIHGWRGGRSWKKKGIIIRVFTLCRRTQIIVWLRSWKAFAIYSELRRVNGHLPDTLAIFKSGFPYSSSLMTCCGIPSARHTTCLAYQIPRHKFWMKEHTSGLQGQEPRDVTMKKRTLELGQHIGIIA